jgi:hypothetical protein
MRVIAFPKYIEVDFLINKYNLTDNIIDKTLIREAIAEIRKVHGLFQEHHFNAVIQLLEHDWLPSDIPVLLPCPAFNY